MEDLTQLSLYDLAGLLVMDCGCDTCLARTRLVWDELRRRDSLVVSLSQPLTEIELDDACDVWWMGCDESPQLEDAFKAGYALAKKEVNQAGESPPNNTYPVAGSLAVPTEQEK